MWHFGYLKGDDQLYVTGNPHVVGGLTPANIAWALTSFALPYWHPLTRLSHLVDVQLFGFAAIGPHVENVVWHALNAILVWLLVWRLTGRRARALMVAAIFAVHPLHVESVVWVAERKDVLSTCLALVTLIAYAAYARRPARRRYLSTMGLFALALTAKPMVVTVPAVMLLLDVWPLARAPWSRVAGDGAPQTKTWTALLVEKAPFVALGLAVAVMTVAAERGTSTMPTLTSLPWPLRVEGAIQAYVAYLGKAIWPVGLAAFYPRDWSPSAAIVAVEAAALAAATIACVRQRRERPYLLVGWLWFVVTLLPVIGIVQSGEQAMADRFMYVPLIGLTIAGVWLAADAIARVETWPAWIAPACAAPIVIGCAWLARHQVAFWQDEPTLWRHAVAVTDRNYAALDYLGLALEERGDATGALDAYRGALAAAPAHERDFAGLVHANIADTIARQGRPADAIPEYLAALRLDPGLPDAESDLGAALAAVNRPAEAAAHFRAALQLRPGFAEAENGLGAVLAMEGRAAEAAAHYRAAVAIKPDLAVAHTNLAMVLAAEGRNREAVDELLAALRIDPNHATWEFNVGSLLMRQGLAQDAASHFNAALAIDPTFDRARQALEAIPTVPR